MTTITPEQRRAINYQSDCAVALFTMVSLHVHLPGGHKIHVYAAPWNCLETARSFYVAGATWICLLPVGTEGWHWRRPTPQRRRSRDRSLTA